MKVRKTKMEEEKDLKSVSQRKLKPTDFLHKPPHDAPPPPPYSPLPYPPPPVHPHPMPPPCPPHCPGCDTKPEDVVPGKIINIVDNNIDKVSSTHVLNPIIPELKPSDKILEGKKYQVMFAFDKNGQGSIWPEWMEQPVIKSLNLDARVDKSVQEAMDRLEINHASNEHYGTVKGNPNGDISIDDGNVSINKENLTATDSSIGFVKGSNDVKISRDGSISINSVSTSKIKNFENEVKNIISENVPVYKGSDEIKISENNVLTIGQVDQSKVKGLSTVVKDINTKIDTVNTKIDSTDKKVNYVDKKIDNTLIHLEELEGNLVLTDKKVDSIKKDVCSTKKEVENVKKQIIATNTEVVLLKSGLETANTAIENANSKIESNKNDILLLKSKVSSAESNIASAKADIDSVKTSVSNLNSEVTNVKSSIAETNQKIIEVENKIPLIKSSTAKNKISIGKDGTMTVNSLDIGKVNGLLDGDKIKSSLLPEITPVDVVKEVKTHAEELSANNSTFGLVKPSTQFSYSADGKLLINKKHKDLIASNSSLGFVKGSRDISVDSNGSLFIKDIPLEKIGGLQQAIDTAAISVYNKVSENVQETVISGSPVLEIEKTAEGSHISINSQALANQFNTDLSISQILDNLELFGGDATTNIPKFYTLDEDRPSKLREIKVLAKVVDSDYHEIENYRD